MKKLNKKGFTLIELIVVIAILAILAAILVPAIINYVSQANDSKNIANARSIYSEVSITLATETDDTATFTIDNFNAPDSCSITPATLTTADIDNFSVTCEGFTFDGVEITN